MRKAEYVIAIVLLFIVYTAIAGFADDCNGDFNCDGSVDGEDLAAFAEDFGRSDCGTSDLILRIEALEDKVAQLESLLAGVTREGKADIVFEGVNVHIVNGSGDTDSKNGWGNLIVGYNELRSIENDRTGSHNIVVGQQNNYSSFGGLVVGYRNAITGEHASVSGGIDNTASGDYASISGGRGNRASATGASVSGGGDNEASSDYASVSGGHANTAYSSFASVSGGVYNEAGYMASVSGGWENKATGHTSSIGGGRNNVASGVCAFVGGGGGPELSDTNRAFADYSAILGGWRNTTGDPDLLDHEIGTQSVVSAGSTNIASGNRSSVSGGYNNTASGTGASVSGGRYNNAGALAASVSGGYETSVVDSYDWAAGDLYEVD